MAGRPALATGLLAPPEPSRWATLMNWWNQQTQEPPAPALGMGILQEAFVKPAINGLTAVEDAYQGRIPMWEIDPVTGEGRTSTAMVNRAAEAAEVAGTGGLATAGMRPGVGMFGGVMAKTADMDALTKAMNLEAKGGFPSDIFQETGWFKGGDGKWRFEIDDSRAFTKGYGPMSGIIEKQGATTQNVMRHPDLWEAYPELGNIEMGTFRGGAGHKGRFQPGDMLDVDRTALLSVNDDLRGDAMGSTMLHELQHAIQGYEGFARGANADALKPGTPAWTIYAEIKQKMLTPLPIEEYAKQAGFDNVKDAAKSYKEYVRDIKKNADKYDVDAQRTAVQEAYRRAGGEVEARNVQKRMNMTAQQRREMAPWYTQDIPPDQAIY